MTNGREPLTDDELVDSWAVVVQAFARTNQQLMDDIDGRTGLQASWFEVLLRLHRTPDKRMPMNRIASDMTMTSGGFTKLADRMVEADLLHRIPSEDDRRVIYLELTPNGAQVAQRGVDEHVAGLRTHLLGVLSEEQLVQLSEVMRTLRDAAS